MRCSGQHAAVASKAAAHQGPSCRRMRVLWLHAATAQQTVSGQVPLACMSIQTTAHTCLACTNPRTLFGQECAGCGRTFAPAALQRHAGACKAVFQQKRRRFDAQAARLEGTEAQRTFANARREEEDASFQRRSDITCTLRFASCWGQGCILWFGLNIRKAGGHRGPTVLCQCPSGRRGCRLPEKVSCQL